MYYTYILKSQKDDKYYIGFSSDLKKRFEQHTLGKVNATKNRRPLKLIYYEAYQTENNARLREKNLKKFGSAYSGLIKRIKMVP
ncbi:MAG: excinuclease ABC subunit C [Candidatus Magasanikbacteria bacterium CG10_big_fil_rev_8_21_14_0_10_36_16]|uniref:Excinuclease ABC subunit C n=1 Tax=Candidatus Magasanikbacteria bacterium CG10_big_fil_rev_8_21_14_0_10_36_16 TaxID=1974645 RepID=A0A2H0TYD1_9BACT|nr:MAG: excinuclease ABC subunit C [Candidatus Magasanikbacteria bacterium CG10_big_fil_rev_8_21_14_0_10_36_16]